MHESSGGNEQNGRTYLQALNVRVIMTVTVVLAVVLAGCVGGLGGSGDGEAGIAEADKPGGGADGDSNGADGTKGANGAGSSDGADASSGNGGNELTKINVPPREEDWFNATENGYEFEVVDVENGSGTASFEPPVNPTKTLYPTVTYEGDESFEQAYSGTEDALGDPTGAVLQPLALGGLFGYGIEGEDLSVGYENSSTSDGATVTEKITGVESYAGVECYAYEMTVDNRPAIETCIVPYTEEAIVSDYSPYVVIYDESDEMTIEVKLTEIREE